MAYEVVARPTDGKSGKYEVVSRPKPQAPTGPQPGGSLMDHYNRILGETQGSMREGYGRMTTPGAGFAQRALGAGQAALGGIGYVGSPFSAAMRRVFGNPAEVGARAFGASPETQVQVGDVAGMAGEILGPAGAYKAVQQAPAIANAAAQTFPAINRGATAIGSVLRGTVNAADDVVNSMRQGAQARAGARQAERDAIPSKEVLKTAGGGEFQAAKALGGDVRPEVFQSRISGLRNHVNTKYKLQFEDTYPTARKMIEALEGQMEDISSFEDLMGLQKEARNFVKRAKKAAENTGDNSDYAASQMAMKDLDDFIANLKPEDMVGGNVEAANASLRQAKELWARQAKLDVVDDILEQARRLDDPDIVKQGFRKLAKDDFEYERFTDAERKMIEQLASKGILDEFAHAGALGVVKSMARRAGTKAMRESIQNRSVQKLKDMIARGQGDQETRAASKAAETPFSERVRGVMDKSPQRIEEEYRRRAQRDRPYGR